MPSQQNRLTHEEGMTALLIGLVKLNPVLTEYGIGRYRLYLSTTEEGWVNLRMYEKARPLLTAEVDPRTHAGRLTVFHKEHATERDLGRIRMGLIELAGAIMYTDYANTLEGN